MTNDEFRKNAETPIENYREDSLDVDSERWEMIFWGADPSNDGSLHETAEPKRVFDLEARTARFGETIIRFCKKVPHAPVNNPLIDQLVRARTSVGANYCEADDSVSRKDFKHKIGICRKEARESKFFLRMVATAEPALKPAARVIWREAKELHLIFSAIWRK